MKNKSYNKAPHASCNCGKECSCKNCRCGPHALFFDTLGNATRLYILYFLQTGPKNVSEIVKHTNLEQTQVSHALKHLEECGFVTSKQQGKFRIYVMNKKTMGPLMKLIDAHVKKYCAPRANPCCCSEEKS